LYVIVPLARDSSKIEYIEAYLKAVGLFRNYDDPSQDPVYSEVTSVTIAIYNKGLSKLKTIFVIL